MPAALPCPHCQQEVLVQDEYLGRLMSCPRCQQTFTVPAILALPEPSRSTIPPPAAETAPLLELTPEQGPKKSLPPSDPASFQMQAERSAQRASTFLTAAETTRGRHEPERSLEKQPQRRLRLQTQLEPHRGVLILILGLTTILLTGCPPLAWILAGAPLIMSRADLIKMAVGRMDAAGRGLTQAGRALAMTGLVLSTLVMFVILLLQLTNID